MRSQSFALLAVVVGLAGCSVESAGPEVGSAESALTDPYAAVTTTLADIESKLGSASSKRATDRAKLVALAAKAGGDGKAIDAQLVSIFGGKGLPEERARAASLLLVEQWSFYASALSSAGLKAAHIENVRVTLEAIANRDEKAMRAAASVLTADLVARGSLSSKDRDRLSGLYSNLTSDISLADAQLRGLYGLLGAGVEIPVDHLEIFGLDFLGGILDSIFRLLAGFTPPPPPAYGCDPSRRIRVAGPSASLGAPAINAGVPNYYERYVNSTTQTIRVAETSDDAHSPNGPVTEDLRGWAVFSAAATDVTFTATFVNDRTLSHAHARGLNYARGITTVRLSVYAPGGRLVCSAGATTSEAVADPTTPADVSSGGAPRTVLNCSAPALSNGDYSVMVQNSASTYSRGGNSDAVSQMTISAASSFLRCPG